MTTKVVLPKLKIKEVELSAPNKLGRKSKDANTAEIQLGLTEAALYAKKILTDYLRGKDRNHKKVEPISMTKLKACELAINHAIGTPRQKIEWNYSPGMLTIKDISELAREHDLRDFETTTKELAGKGGEKN